MGVKAPICKYIGLGIDANSGCEHACCVEFVMVDAAWIDGSQKRRLCAQDVVCESSKVTEHLEVSGLSCSLFGCEGTSLIEYG